MSPERPIPSSGSPLNPIGGNGAKSKPAIPDHELIRCIGEGAYGEVWLARNILGTYRAIKIVYRKSFRDEHTYEREFRGIQQFEPISRTNDGLLDILQAGRNDDAGYYYYVMELADGEEMQNEKCKMKNEGAANPTASDRQKSILNFEFYILNYHPKTLATVVQQRGRLPPAECVQLGLNLTLALGHLHRHKLIHRDIKPANIIFVQGIPKLADIGLVTNFDDTCSFVGTEGFIAPEGPTSPRADLYSLGKVLYEISTGRDRKDFPEPATGLGEDSDWQESAELNAVILKACAVDARDRYQTAEEFHADLALLNSGKSVRWKRVVEKRLAFARKAGAVVGIIALLAFGGYLYQRHQTREAKRLQQIAEDLLAQRDIQHAETLLDRGESSLALAHLAQVLRRHPDNRVAAERIMAALTQRNFPRLTTKPLKHEARLITAHFSPDSQSVISASEDNTVRLWNAQTGEEMIPPLRHTRKVNAVEFSPDGSKLATASGDRTVCLWNVRDGTLVFPPLQHDRGVVDVTFDSSGRFIATASLDGRARIYNVDTGQLACAPLVHDGAVNALAFSPDGLWLATGSEDEQVRVWETASGKLQFTFNTTGDVRLVRFSPDGEWLAAALNDRTADDPKRDWQVQIWHLKSGRPLAVPLVHNRVYSLAFSPDSQRLVTADYDNVARVWQVATGKELFRLHHSAIVYSAAYSPGGKQILTASVDHSARLWNASDGAAISERMIHEGRVHYAEFSRNGDRVLTLGWDDKAVKLWDIRPSRPPNRVLPHRSWVMFADFDATGKEAMTATSGAAFNANGINQGGADEQHAVILWDVATGAPKSAPALPEEAQPLVAQFAQTGPLALLATPAYSGKAQLWDLKLGSPIGKTVQLDEEITCARFSPDGLKLAIGSESGTLVLWDVRQGRAMKAFSAHTDRINSVRFNWDEKMLITASKDGTAMIWDALTGQRLATPLEHEAEVWFAQFSPKNDKVLTVSLDYTAKIWSTNGALIATFRHTSPVEYAEFSPDETTVVTASGDKPARIWSVATGKQLTALEHQQLVLMAVFSPDGLRVLTASMDGTAQVWDAATGLKLGDPFRHSDWVVAARFSPDGRRAITASLDNMATIWEVPLAPSPIPSWLSELAEAVGGQRLNSDRISEPVLWTEYVALKARLAKELVSDSNNQWAQHLLTGQTIPTTGPAAVVQPMKPGE